MSNLGLEKHLAGLGLALLRTKVGDRYVVERMRADGCNVGGEQSGHIILSDFATTGDGLLAALQAVAVIRQQEEIRIESAARERKAVHSERRTKTMPAKAASAKEAAEKKKAVTYSNPWKSDGVSGRMVRIGAYGSLEKGKKAWAQLAQLSPSFKRLPAVVTDLPSRTGRIYYWLQVGTTSQAHSEVLCQRMRSIGQSCLVVDLAGARGSGNERQPAGL